VAATRAGLPSLLFLLQPLRVLMKQIRQAVCAIKQSLLLRCLWEKQHNEKQTDFLSFYPKFVER
jgi:hypothetical protein